MIFHLPTRQDIEIIHKFYAILARNAIFSIKTGEEKSQIETVLVAPQSRENGLIILFPRRATNGQCLAMQWVTDQ
ncbi:MAG TPA: hypothetical protein DCS88_03180 [Alphaproteobacteria bacterium]|nr:hypothetical protein [Alphaproteobacteria bacterium]